MDIGFSSLRLQSITILKSFSHSINQYEKSKRVYQLRMYFSVKYHRYSSSNNIVES